MRTDNAVIYPALVNRDVLGMNVKRDGSVRKWNGRLTGKSFKSNRDEVMVQIIETGPSGPQERWLNISTFTGRVGQWEFVEGIRK